MERFVIGAAVAFAALIVFGSVMGKGISDGNGFRFEIGDRDSDGGGGAKGTGVASQTPSTTYAASELKLRDAVAVLKIIPEDRADIALEISNPGTLATPTVKLENDVLVLDGGIGRRVRNCETRNGWEATVNGLGDVKEEQMPVITVRMPRDVDVSVSGAVKTEIGAANSVEISTTGCGPTTIADVAGELEISAAGSGDVTTGAARTASVSAAGSGDVTLGVVAEKFDASVAGSGSVTAASVTGPADVSIAGSGDVAVKAGAVSEADVSIAGSGNVDFASNVSRLDVSIMGSGDVTVRGAAGAVDANIMGSGDVRVTSVSGGVQKAVMGSGSVTVGPISED